MMEHQERVYTIKVDIASNDPDELALQMESLQQDLYDGKMSKDEILNGASQGKINISNYLRCRYCHDEGEVVTDESDGEGHIMSGVGREKCLCQTGS